MEQVNVVTEMKHFVTVENLITKPLTHVMNNQNKYCNYDIKYAGYSNQICLQIIVTLFSNKFQLLLLCYVTEHTLLHN